MLEWCIGLYALGVPLWIGNLHIWITIQVEESMNTHYDQNYMEVSYMRYTIYV